MARFAIVQLAEQLGEMRALLTAPLALQLAAAVHAAVGPAPPPPPPAFNDSVWLPAFHIRPGGEATSMNDPCGPFVFSGMHHVRVDNDDGDEDGVRC